MFTFVSSILSRFRSKHLDVYLSANEFSSSAKSHLPILKLYSYLLKALNEPKMSESEFAESVSSYVVLDKCDSFS